MYCACSYRSEADIGALGGSDAGRERARQSRQAEHAPGLEQLDGDGAVWSVHPAQLQLSPQPHKDGNDTGGTVKFSSRFGKDWP